MPAVVGSRVIPCIDCATEKQKIEEGGTFEVSSCEPLEGQENVPAGQRLCRIHFRLKSIGVEE
jgi:hypothetical protein